MRLVALLLLCLAGPACAAVYEVGDDGTVERLDKAVAVAGPTRHRTARPMKNSRRAAAFQPAVDSAAARYEVSPALIDAIAHVESRYDPAATSRTGAAGIMQLMPRTARDLGVDSRDATANIHGGTAYLRQLLNRFDGDVIRTVAAYNAGPAAVVRAGGVPHYPETIAYVASVMDRLAASAR